MLQTLTDLVKFLMEASMLLCDFLNLLLDWVQALLNLINVLVTTAIWDGTYWGALFWLLLFGMSNDEAQCDWQQDERELQHVFDRIDLSLLSKGELINEVANWLNFLYNDSKFSYHLSHCCAGCCSCCYNALLAHWQVGNQKYLLANNSSSWHCKYNRDQLTQTRGSLINQHLWVALSKVWWFACLTVMMMWSQLWRWLTTQDLLMIIIRVDEVAPSYKSHSNCTLIKSDWKSQNDDITRLDSINLSSCFKMRDFVV